MTRPAYHEIVRVIPPRVHNELAEIIRQKNMSQTVVAKHVLRSPGLARMVNAVASGEIDGMCVRIVIRG
ncbi:MAG: hypothetical protein IIB58_02050 [Planctomycetes bacterium]|nr:hypothetical protein [Planctomycetota bacterium]